MSKKVERIAIIGASRMGLTSALLHSHTSGTAIAPISSAQATDMKNHTLESMKKVNEDMAAHNAKMVAKYGGVPHEAALSDDTKRLLMKAGVEVAPPPKEPFQHFMGFPFVIDDDIPKREVHIKDKDGNTLKVIHV